MRTNTTCFYFDPFSGVVSGLPVSENVPNLKRPGRHHPPCVQFGEAFIMIDNVKSPTMKIIDDTRWVLDGRLRTIYPNDPTRSAFNVISREGDSGVLVLVSIRPRDHRVKEKESWLNAWEGIVTDDNVEVVKREQHSALFRLTEVDQEIDVFQHNGLVHRLRFDGTKVKTLAFDRVDMARIRTSQFGQQISQLGTSTEDGRRYQGVLWGAARLLRFSAKDMAVRTVLVEFLSEQVGQMAERLREEVRSILLQTGDPLAGTFVYGENVVSLAEKRTTAIGQQLAEAKRKKAERQERDRQERLAMRGSSGGGNNSRKQAEKRK